MFGYLVLLFTLVPALELIVLIEVGSRIGSINTIFLILFTGVLGAYLARMQGFLILQKIQNQLNQGQMPNDQLIDGAMILAGGIVLLTPGFITDTLGIILLTPLTRTLIKKWLIKRFAHMITTQQTFETHTFRRNDGYDDIDAN